jgi:hypothetical protein
MKKEKFLDTNIINKSKSVEDKIQLIDHQGLLRSRLVSQELVIGLVHFALVVHLILKIKKNLLEIHFMKNFA